MTQTVWKVEVVIGCYNLCVCVGVFVQMQDTWEGDMALTIAKNLPAGLHLYDTLTGNTHTTF